MWPFKKTHPPLTELPREGSWQVTQGQYDGKPLVVRLNVAVDRFRAHPDLGYQVGVAIPFTAPDERGLPQGEELEELNRIEDHIFATLQIACRSVVAAVITTNGMREFVLYAHDPAEIEAKHGLLKTLVESQHEVQLMIQPDPTWRVFAQFR
jgi:hypothetical protein